MSIDPTALRLALRVVHCLQKERGASCAFASLLGDLPRARSNTDKALDRAAFPLHTLHKIRKLVDEDCSVRRILVSFNTLISAVLHEYVLRFTRAKLLRRSLSGEFGSRVRSYQNLPVLGKQMRRRQVSESNLSQLAPETSLYTSKVPSSDVRQPTSGEMEDDDEGSERLHRLLRLLDIFVQLKESTGVERATLTSLLTYSEDALLVNDVVVAVENQRRLVDGLRRLKGPIQSLVQDVITMNPQLQKVQNLVLTGFSLESLQEQYDANKLWDIMTVYIDKLHSLELLIVEEIECCLPTKKESSWKAALGDLKGIEVMPGEEVKERVIQALKPAATSPLQRVSGVDDLLEELKNDPKMKEWEIDIYELRFLKRIGQGGAGTTYLADWSGLNVAVKVASITDLGLEGWRTEVQALTKLHHPNIIRLLGSVYHPHPLTFCLVLEYCESGDLSTALQKVTPQRFFLFVGSSIAKGCAYLHHRGVIHRDIKPSNVLIHGDIASGNYQVKVTDFGVAAELELNAKKNRTAETGTYRWMAPEVIRHEEYSQLADVYSYAIVVWQLLTREEPFADKSQIEAAVAVSMESSRPPFPNETPKSLIEFIDRCWHDNQELRPSFDDISNFFAQLESTISEEERRWLDAPLGHPVYKIKKTKEIKVVSHQQSQGDTEANNGQEKKKGKGFRKALFSRKSTYF